jgi:Transposase IS116/IS110/IS902 family
MLSVASLAGIDVGKQYHDVGFFPAAKPLRVVNEPTGIAKIVSVLRARGVGRVALEAIGSYTRKVICALVEAFRFSSSIRGVEVLAWHRTSQESRRLETIHGVGFITATAIAATVTGPSHFRIEPGIFSLAGVDPTAKFVGRQRPPRPRFEDGQRLCAFSHRRRGHVDDPLCFARRARSVPDGSTRCSRRSPLGSSRLRSPIKRRGSLGRCSSGRNSIGFLSPHKGWFRTRRGGSIFSAWEGWL